jgi:acylphosphatase
MSTRCERSTVPMTVPTPTNPHPYTDDSSRLTAWVRGRVQGVGFRWWTRARALELGLVGWARNLDDGRVEVVAEGSRGACDSLLAQLCAGDGPGRVDGVTHRWSAPGNGHSLLVGFVER